MDETFSHIYTHAVRMADIINTAPSMPRLVGRQVHHVNAPAVNPEEHYRRNVAIPFMNHIQSELEEQFSGLSVHASRLHCFVPSILCEKFPDEEAEAILDTYKDDLPSLELLHQELVRFKIRYDAKQCNDRPSTAVQALKECDRDMFPNISTLLQICCTIPATSCECERSASALRRLHTYNRSCMGQERLSALALYPLSLRHRRRPGSSDQSVCKKTP
ncbi:52 kDa repressor of the inhibitor of the protein kinase-like [Nematostella vectensis]|uniref:52 kDa repressor of the inhibitor of the protein kinase-like n=1 Tax=Nematostella vectensis TaxID=45351 RepID=UPI002077348F|nr:52 kDa repressor of the inhibitor of the protein kinase-like [Nematostella vectensis]